MNDDLISRKKVLTEIRRIAPVTHKITGSDAQIIMGMIEQLSPAIEAELMVHAHWIRLEPRADLRGRTHKCSRCEKHGYKDDKRCSDCGAVMDEKHIEPTPLIRLGLGGRINKRLKQMGIDTAEQLEAMNKYTLRNIPGLGKKSIEIIETELRIWKMEKEKQCE